MTRLKRFSYSTGKPGRWNRLKDLTPMSEKNPPENTPPDDFKFPALHKDEPAAPPIVSSAPPPALPSAEPVESAPPSSSAASAAKFRHSLQDWFLKNKSKGMVVVFVGLAGLMWAVSWWRNHQTAAGPGGPDPVVEASPFVSVN